MRPRLIPLLLWRDGGLVKTIKFRNPKYVGDPINAVRVFNEKEVDEIFVFDIEATPNGRGPNFALVEDLASECFMPLAYGGGITRADEAVRLVRMGAEKVVLNTAAALDCGLVGEIACRIGSQSVVVAVDVARSWLGRLEVRVRGGSHKVSGDLVDYCSRMESHGAGELLLQSIDRDGTGEGYALDDLRQVSEAVKVPVVIAGGCGSLKDAAAAFRAGASGAAAGSLFTFYGKHRAVLISYPSPAEVDQLVEGLL